MKFKIETFGSKVKVATSAHETAYLDAAPKVGQVVRVKGSNGPVNRMVLNADTMS